MGVELVEGIGYEPYEARKLYVSTIVVKKYIVALVPNNIKYGAWDNVKLYVLKDKSLTQQYRSNMSKPLNKQIMANI